MSAIQATASGTYFQYIQQSQQVNGQSRDTQISNQNQSADTIVKQATSSHLKNAESVMSAQQNQGRGNIVDFYA